MKILNSIKNKKALSLRGFFPLIIYIFLAVGCSSPLKTATKKNWVNLPLYENGFQSFNLFMYLLGYTYGEKEVYKALMQAHLKVKNQHPKTITSYGHFSKRGGGQLLGHKSHKKGIDIDLFPEKIYLTKVGYIQNYSCKNGYLKNGKTRLDIERLWIFLMGLKQQKHRAVRRVLIEPCHKSRIIKWAKKNKKSQNEIAWAQGCLRYAGSHAADHKDHIHVKFVNGKKGSRGNKACPY